MRRALVFSALIIVGAAVWAGFGNAGNNATRSAKATTSVTISNEQGTTWTCGFNPMNADVQPLSFGPVYEELVFVNGLKSGQTTNWLASGYKWGNGNKTLTFTIRSGVKWSDGKPFNADDVIFTYKLLKKYPALDLNADWSVLKSVSKQGNKVVFSFKTSAGVPYFYYIAAQTPIVAKHVWSKIKNPVTYKDPHPVGTGPFKMSSCSPQVIKYQKNAGYWQKGLPKLDTIYYPAFTSNDPANQQLASGKAQWGSQFIPNIKAYYSSKSKDNHYWFPPTVNVDIFFNLKNPVLSNVAVRRAIAYAIDRGKVSRIGEYGYEPASNQTGIVTPTFSSWLDKGLASKITYNPAKAISILQKAGFTKKGGVFAKNGKALSFRIINIGGYSDWVASVQVIQQELKAVGIKVTPENLSSTTYNSDAYTGKFELAYDGNETGGPAPYYELRQLLYSKNSAPIGKTASSNWERYYNPAVDRLIEQYGATTDPGKQHSIIKQLEAAMVNDVPVIPVTEGVDWYQYNTKNITGWVTQSNPYARPSAYTVPDWGVVAMRLRPK